MRVALFVVPLFIGCNGGNDDPNDKDKKDTDTGPTVTTFWECTIPAGDAPDSAPQIGCAEDFDMLASAPLDASIPGARSVKTVIDRSDGDALYFMNSVKYPIHWDFAFNNLSVANGLQPVSDLGTFNQVEYYSPDRRFVLGAVTYYEGAAAWVYEIAPYDTATADMVTLAFYAIRDNAFFGKDLYFHPSSVNHEALLGDLPVDIPIITTDELFAGIDYQPYNMGLTTGLLRFYGAEEVDGSYTPFRELAVLDAVPNDISIVAGIITGEFQTPLAHINVLSVNRGTPNMGLRDAQQHPDLVALEGKWVELDVQPFEWTIREITEAEAEIWWQANKPPPLTVPSIDLSVTDLRDVEGVIVDGNDLADEIATAITAFGSKGTNYSALYDIGADVVPIQDGFIIPMYHFDRHMTVHGFWTRLIDLMASPGWADPLVRATELEQMKLDMVAAPLDPVLLADVLTVGAIRAPGPEIRFRSSTNAEDLGTFTGAGLYNSQTGDIALANTEVGSVEWAIKEAWANLWNPRAYEERDYYSIDQLAVGMALLSTANFPDEEANGVAITNNIFDVSGLEPAFYVNVQMENFEVVQPAPGVLPDAYIHYFYNVGQPVVYITHSNLIPAGDAVLTPVQINQLGLALEQIHLTFFNVYGNDGDWYGMDVEFKFDDKFTPGTEALFIKQARPFPWVPGASGAE